MFIFTNACQGCPIWGQIRLGGKGVITDVKYSHICYIVGKVVKTDVKYSHICPIVGKVVKTDVKYSHICHIVGKVVKNDVKYSHICPIGDNLAPNPTPQLHLQHKLFTFIFSRIFVHKTAVKLISYQIQFATENANLEASPFL